MQCLTILPRTVLAVLLVVFTWQAYAADDAYWIDQKTFKKTIKTVAMAPAEAGAALNMPSGIGVLIENEVAARLERKFDLIVPDRYRTIRDEMERQVGGYLVAGTDEPDSARILAVREHSFREMLFQYHMDAIVTVQVRLVGAPFDKNKAEWDGVSQNISTKGGRSLFSDKFGGTVTASSLQISIFDRRQNLLYSARGGIEVVMQIDEQSLVPLPTDQLFQDEKLIKKAVQLALKQL
ncbi:MAG: hypothetical protein O3A63_06220 [Proteobacteria bacterium]|nr:hypothetical protein [Pseudomonadota bacterium]